ncbi:MAG TPA: ribonuclease D [Parvibaculum sp.]|uniref:ribonuclease D n=1 Tax=Parvibaculum sp. TaxID=2024848 RepID=UPI002B5578DA|nr:ribonuclease D [Parvibaculum sp.]HMM14648.1 ribonuclease D [Parvibaculum sp.]
MNIITNTDALAATCARLAGAGYVTVDTEFMRDSTFWPKLCLIQLASPGEACIVDPQAPGIDLAPFYELMRNKQVVKVFHAARQDIEIFWHEAETIPDPLFDTQVAAMVCGFGESVGYETLVRKLTGGSVDKSSRFTDWSRRPLSDKQLQYACGDVTHLRKIYEVLARRLTQTGRARWVAEEMAILQDPETYAQRPEDAWKRIKMRFKGQRGLAVLVEIAAWRERQAQERDLPRSRILKDDALAEIATQIPRVPEDLDRLRAVPKGFANSRTAASIMEAVERGLSMREDLIPVVKDSEPLPPGIGPLVELLKVLLSLRSEEHEVAQKLVARTSDLELIAAHDEPDVPALKGWRREIFGADAQRLKRGELALSARGKKILLLETAKGGR